MKIAFDWNKKIGIAVSGGVDSMVLLDLMSKQSKNIVILNVEHGIRGEISRRDTLFVKKYADNLGINCIFKSVDAISYSKEKNISIELAARELRYQFFDSLIQSGVVDEIALAHHLDDQAETILMRIFRGTGVRGLRGIVDRLGYIHPLISITKADILEYALRNKIPFVDDHTNLESDYTRNYIRNEIMPLVKEKYNDVLSSFDVLSKNAIEIEDYLLKQIVEYKKFDDDSIYLPISVFDLHPLILKKSIVEALRYFDIEKDIEYANLEEIQKLVTAQNNSLIHLPFNVDVIKEYDKLVFCKRLKLSQYCKEFDVLSKYTYAGKEYVLSKMKPEKKKGFFDIEKLPKDTVIRTRKDKDIFTPYEGKRQLLSDYLTNKKVPKRVREKLLVVAKGSEVFIVLGIEISDKVKITNDTKLAYFFEEIKY